MNRNELQCLLNIAACCEIDRRQRKDQEEEEARKQKKKKKDEDIVEPNHIQSSLDTPAKTIRKRKTLIIPGAVP